MDELGIASNYVTEFELFYEMVYTGYQIGYQDVYLTWA